MTANQALIDEIVTNVLAKLQPITVRPVSPAAKAPTAAAPIPTVTVTAPTVGESKPSVVELVAPVITADLLQSSVRSGQTLRIGRSSILTPSARDWLNAKKLAWSRLERQAGVNGASADSRVRWQIILQTVTPTVRALQDGLRTLAEGIKIELVGQPVEATVLATNLINTAECDGVVIFTEQAELIACKANRSDRVRAAVMQNSKQWELVMRTLSANVVCISPVGKTFVELRNLLRDCVATKPRTPTGF
jgi:hypothetical protein